MSDSCFCHTGQQAGDVKLVSDTMCVSRSARVFINLRDQITVEAVGCSNRGSEGFASELQAVADLLASAIFSDF